MDTIHIRGGRRLKGRIPVSGAKNAALPLMTAALLTDEPLKLANMPRLADVKTLTKLLRALGASVSMNDGGDADVMTIRAADITSTTAPYEIVSQIRASFWVLGPLLGRCRKAKVSLPGGCAIGARPVDLYIKGLQKMGAEIDLVEGYVLASAPDGLKGAVVRSPIVSVGATHTLMMAATLADGLTVLENAAREPEICDVANCLVAMGAKIEGIGTSTLRIEGVEKLHGATHSVIADRIEAGTYAVAAAMAGGEVVLEGALPETFEAALSVLRAAGAEVESEQGAVRISRNGECLQATDVVTQVFPGFPTDLQAQFMALMTMADGESEITETIFENRFMHVQELARFGADISLHGDKALVRGVEKLKGAPVMASDLRASAALIIAGLAAEGETVVNRVYHLDRGFERIEAKLSACGAEIWREKA
ncbi:UDP-N-acetylglucosamine 1-carboxyvinyltransferase [Parvibaculum sp.]|jgi:UDP-N-acetylglucosamine 1-carboxyvinyltransferase|uniref:UDP-N-acetylglucosamine 1-carboxyvinyltransferase n=1 Tax=Parvibaculum sp. TaxID=2024848 RepID=UPI000C449B18|nr:UDP-N-acetylglucosamine 1-carboxyvinyltransferase [Parvibaculum sp.]MAM95730.1 UDP-N-acetylglucosamine 1-carboxyvinyltransferase [Parvibaculum sp.]|tara:strand:- start:11249 stop:12520 length:1272 start_codon:yes stop_codon:yes gene_type:complete